MRVLVTGATGFVGSHLVESLLHSGHEVTCLVRKTSSLKWLEGLKYSLRHASLDDINTIKPALEGQDIVIHCAGLVRATNHLDFFRVNTQGTANLSRAAAEAVPRIRQFILISSQSAVGPSAIGRPISETSQPNPIDLYGKSKLQGELELRRFSDALPITIIRPSAIYGPRDQDIYLVFKAVHRHIRPVAGLGHRIVSLCHVSDVVQVIMLTVGNARAFGQTYMASTDKPASWLEITSAMAAAMRRRAVLLPVPPALLLAVAAWNEVFGKLTGRPRTFDVEKARVMLEASWQCDVSKAMNELGYRPRIGLEQGVKTTYNWYLEQGWL